MASYSSLNGFTEFPPSPKLNPRPNDQSSRPLLRYHKRAVVLLILYIPLIIIPWIATCILADRPITGHPYLYSHGLTWAEVKGIRSWTTTINTLNSIASLATIPIISALLAQAAVVYSQRRSLHQHLSVRQLFALADRGWADVTILLRSWRWNEPGSWSWRAFLYSATILLLISAIQHPLYQLLVPSETIVVTTCADTYYIEEPGYHTNSKSEEYCRASDTLKTIGTDIEPSQMAMMPQDMITLRLIRELASTSLDTTQSRLWPDYDDAGTISRINIDVENNLRVSRWRNDLKEEDIWYAKNTIPMFVAALPTNTTTGVLREHIMRFNSSVDCRLIDRSQFPQSCPGVKPFVNSFESKNGIANMTVRVCVPGEWGRSPWTLSRNRQELTEEIFIDMQHKSNGVSVRSEFRDITATLQCNATTTRGYFELGNNRNNQTYGPLLGKWPSREEMLEEFNDYFDAKTPFYIPSEEDPASRNYYESEGGFGAYNVSGPLTTSALALFGNDSWFQAAANYSSSLGSDRETIDKQLDWQRVCSLMPFNRLDESSADEWRVMVHDFPPCQSNTVVHASDSYYGGLITNRDLDGTDLIDLLNVWLVAWNTTVIAERALSSSLFLANQVIFSTEFDKKGGKGKVGRAIYSSDGATLSKPRVTPAAKIIISLLVAIQILGLIVIGCFIYWLPTWTTAFNALALARIGNSLDSSLLPGFEISEERDLDKLKEASGVVGVVEKEKLNHSLMSLHSEGSHGSNIETLLRSDPVYVLQLGASGIISRETGARPKRFWEGDRV